MSDDWAYQQRLEQIGATARSMLCNKDFWEKDPFLGNFGYENEYTVTLSMDNSEGFTPAELISAMRARLLQYVVEYPEKDYPSPHIPDHSDDRGIRDSELTMPEFRNWSERIRYCLNPDNHRGRARRALIEFGPLRLDPLEEELLRQSETLFSAKPVVGYSAPSHEGADDKMELPEDRRDIRSYMIRIHPGLLEDFRHEQSKVRE